MSDVDDQTPARSATTPAHDPPRPARPRGVVCAVAALIALMVLYLIATVVMHLLD